MASMLIIDGLRLLGDRLLAFLPSYFKAKQEHRDRLARYCEQIAECLTRAHQQLESGRIPHGSCAEMEQYIHDMRGVLNDVLPQADLDSLQDAMAVSHRVEYLYQELSSARMDSRGAEIEMAAGRFRAIAERIRATRSTLTSP